MKCRLPPAAFMKMHVESRPEFINLAGALCSLLHCPHNSALLIVHQPLQPAQGFRGLDVCTSTIKLTGLITEQWWAGPAAHHAHARNSLVRSPTPPTHRQGSNIIVSSPSGTIICRRCAAASCRHRWRRSTAAHLEVKSRSQWKIS